MEVLHTRFQVMNRLARDVHRHEEGRRRGSRMRVSQDEGGGPGQGAAHTLPGHVQACAGRAQAQGR